MEISEERRMQLNLHTEALKIAGFIGHCWQPSSFINLCQTNSAAEKSKRNANR